MLFACFLVTLSMTLASSVFLRNQTLIIVHLDPDAWLWKHVILASTGESEVSLHAHRNLFKDSSSSLPCTLNSQIIYSLLSSFLLSSLLSLFSPPLPSSSSSALPLSSFLPSTDHNSGQMTKDQNLWTHESREASPPPSFSPQEIIKVTSSPGPPIPTTSQDKSSCEHSSPGPSPSWSLFVYCPQPWHLLKGHFYIPRARLEFVILLPQPAKYWDSKCVPPYSASLF